MMKNAFNADDTDIKIKIVESDIIKSKGRDVLRLKLKIMVNCVELSKINPDIANKYDSLLYEYGSVERTYKGISEYFDKAKFKILEELNMNQFAIDLRGKTF